MAPVIIPMNKLQKCEKPMSSARGRMCPAGGSQFVPLVVAVVGLPARGKTLLAHGLQRYLNFSGHNTRVFALSSYRSRSTLYNSNDVFNPVNTKASEVLKFCSEEAIRDAKKWLDFGGEIAILDGTNATIEVRQCIHSLFRQQMGFKVLFIECILEDKSLIDENIKETAQLSGEYSHLEYNEAVHQVYNKIKSFSSIYEPISSTREASCSYIKFYNAGENLQVHRLDGPYQNKVLSFISSFRPIRKTLYFSRHGESEYNVVGRIGGDAELSPRGRAYAARLASYFAAEPPSAVWTSEKLRTKQTASGLRAPLESIHPLNELDAGICEGLSYEEMQERFPQEFAWRDQDKLRYRYPWGESYLDIMARLDPVLLELERTDGVLVVSHQAILRCVLGYFLNTPLNELPYVKVPLHTIIKVTSKGYLFNVEFIKFNVDCVDTHRKQPKNCSTSRSVDDVLLSIPAHLDDKDLWMMDTTLTT